MQPTNIDVADLPVARTGWQGVHVKAEPKLYTKDQLVNELGFEYYNWDGR
jgi:hypothetical protein